MLNDPAMVNRGITSTKPELQLALIGVGRWGRNYLQALGRSLAAVVDPDARVQQQFRNSGIAVFSTLEELLSDSLRIDATIIAAPARTHYALANKVLSRGISALVEKPMAGSLAEAQRLYSIAADNHAALMSGHLLLHHDGLRDLWQAVQGGSIGKIMHLRSTRIGVGRIREEEDVLWSFGVHNLVLLLTLTGSLPESISARKLKLRGAGQADLVLAALQFDSGVTASVHASWLGPEREHRLLVYGTAATARLDDGEQFPRDLLIQPSSGIAAFPETSHYRAPNAGSSMSPLDRQVMLFSRYVQRKASPEEDKAIALAVMALLELADASSVADGNPSMFEEFAENYGLELDSTMFRPSHTWDAGSQVD